MKTDLLSMGYRCLGTNAAGVTVWAKPFGNTLLVIAVSGADLTLAQHFKGRDGQRSEQCRIRWFPEFSEGFKMAQIYLVEVTGKRKSCRWFVAAESDSDAIQAIKDRAEPSEQLLMSFGDWKSTHVGKTLQLQVRRKTRS